MSIKEFFRKDPVPGLSTSEIVTIAYMFFTAILTLVFWKGMSDPAGMLLTRVWVFLGMVVLFFIYKIYSCRATWLLRCIPPLLCLIIWYPETYEFCRQFPYLDHIFAEIDQILFDCQPSIVFSQKVTSVFWSEAFNLGYYSYYYMMAIVVMFYYFNRVPQSEKAAFAFLTSFFLFYTIYIFLPVAGPCFYFEAIGLENAEAGAFTDIGNYFRDHTEMLHQDVRGVFSGLVQSVQEAGERPVAAFPSSHVGMSTVTMLMAHHTHNRLLFWGLVPFYVLLCCATVFIQAHYLIDSICGFGIAFVFYFLSRRLYNIFYIKEK